MAGYTEQRFHPSCFLTFLSSGHPYIFFSFHEMLFPLLVPGLFFLSFMVLAMYRVHSSMCTGADLALEIDSLPPVTCARGAKVVRLLVLGEPTYNNVHFHFSYDFNIS